MDGWMDGWMDGRKMIRGRTRRKKRLFLKGMGVWSRVRTMGWKNHI
jgi:hypothetical protein